MSKIMESLGVSDEYATETLAGAIPAPDDGRAGDDALDYFRYG